MRATSIIFAVALLSVVAPPTSSFADEASPDRATTESERAMNLDPARPVHVLADIPASEAAPLQKCTAKPTPVLDPVRRVILIDERTSVDEPGDLAREIVSNWQDTAHEDVDAKTIVLVVYDVDSGDAAVAVGDAWRPEGGVINMSTFWTWVNWRFPEKERHLDDYVCAMLDGLALNVVRTHFRHVLGPEDMPKAQANLIRRVQNAKWKLDGTVESLAGLVEEDAPALTELKRTAGEAQILYFIAECLAFAGEQEKAEMRLEQANELADEARDFIQEYRNALDKVDELRGYLQDVRDDLDEAGDMPFVDESPLRRELRSCESRHRKLAEFAESGPKFDELEDDIHETRTCIVDASLEVADVIETYESVVYGGPLLFLLVVLPAAGAVFVVLRAGASKQRLPLMDAITEWEERRPIYRARLDEITSRLGVGSAESAIEPEQASLSREQAGDVALAYALFDELDGRFDEAEELRARAGTFGALKLKAAHELVVDSTVELTPETIDEASPVRVDIDDPPTFQLPGAVTELEDLTERAVQHLKNDDAQAS